MDEPAELNGVPGPLHVLELKERLKTRQVLSADQVVAYNDARGHATGNDRPDAGRRH